MKRLMLGHAFGAGAIDRVVLIVGAGSVRSQRAAERVGGRRVNAVDRGDTGPHLVYVITADAFAGVAHAARGASAEGEGVEVAPGAAHEVRNRGAEPAEFLVVSQPPSHGDRQLAPADATA